MTCFVKWEFLTECVEKTFRTYGVPEADAKIWTAVLLQSDKKRIESHGVNRFKPIYIDRIQKELIAIRDDAGLTDYHFSFEE